MPLPTISDFVIRGGDDEFGDHSYVDSACGVCGLEGPDEFGNYHLHPDPDCPVHGEENS